MKKVCETCKWYETYTGACCNGDSDYCADYVSSMNSCENWEVCTMSIDPNLLIAAKILHDECDTHRYCNTCRLKGMCAYRKPISCWEIPDPPSETTERQRIEWLRCLPDGEMLAQ